MSVYTVRVLVVELDIGHDALSYHGNCNFYLVMEKEAHQRRPGAILQRNLEIIETKEMRQEPCNQRSTHRAAIQSSLNLANNS